MAYDNIRVETRGRVGLITLSRQFSADFLADAVDVAAANRNIAGAPQHFCRHFMGFDVTIHLDDFAYDAGCIRMRVHLQNRTLREKNPDDKSGNGTRARHARMDRRRRESSVARV